MLFGDVLEERVVKKYEFTNKTARVYLVSGILVTEDVVNVAFTGLPEVKEIKFAHENPVDATTTGKSVSYEEELPRLSLQELEELLEEAEKLLEEGDITQASEKFYKIAEEIIKLLADSYASELSKEARKKGRWTTTLLEKTVNVLTQKFGEIVHRAWSDAWDLHVKGFHEHLLDKESVNRYAKSIRELFKEFKKFKLKIR